jgi:hypothetical protein
MPYRDKEKKKAFNKVYYEANKEKLKAYREANKEKKKLIIKIIVKPTKKN